MTLPILRLPLPLSTGYLRDRPHDRVFPPDLQNPGFVGSTTTSLLVTWAFCGGAWRIRASKT